jgi:hypothetical protein
MSNLYFLKRHGGYFRPNARGYTMDILEAGLYEHDDAMSYRDIDSPSVLIIPAKDLRDVVEGLKAEGERMIERSGALLQTIDGDAA